MGCQPIVIVLVLLAGDSPERDRLLRTAVAEFQEGTALSGKPEAKDHFRRSANAYASLRAHGLDNADRCRSEGNAALLAGDLPRAILAYRRGVRFAPGDGDLRANLAWARAQVFYSAPDDYGRPPSERWPLWLPRPALTVWLGMASIVFAMTCAAWTRWWMTRRRFFLHATVACYVVASALIVVTAAETWRIHDAEVHPVVVVARDEVLLRTGNGNSYLPRRETPLSRGVEGRLLYERGDWLQIQLAGGEVGWLPRSDGLVDSR